MAGAVPMGWCFGTTDYQPVRMHGAGGGGVASARFAPPVCFGLFVQCLLICETCSGRRSHGAGAYLKTANRGFWRSVFQG